MQQALHNSSIEDFVIIEYHDSLGGRVAHANFGMDANGDPYTVELGASWVRNGSKPADMTD